MNAAGFAVKNALRSKRRTFLTAASVGMSIFAIVMLATFVEAFSAGLDEIERLGRLITRRRTSLFDRLPESLKGRIDAIPGVIYSHGTVWFGGKSDRADLSEEFFANFAEDLETFERTRSVEWASVDDGALDKLRESRTAALIGEKLMKKLKFSVGEKMTLKSPIYGVSAELDLVGTFRSKPGFDENLVFFRRDYLEEVLGRPGKVGVYVVVPEPGRGPEVARAIDKMTENSDSETETATEREFAASFTEMMGNLKQFIAAIGGIVALTIVLVTGNTMAMSARERSNEAAVMMTLGFERWHVVALFLVEGLAVTLLGGALGLGAAHALTARGDFTGGGFFPFFKVSAQTTIGCLGLAAAVGLLASGIPALILARRPIVDGLRKVV